MSAYVVREEAHAIPMRVSGVGSSIWYFHDEVSVAPGPVAESLAETHRVLAPVHPGFWSSSRPDWVRTVEDIADLYVDRINEDGSDVVVLVGSSVGAWIAVELALLLGDRVTQLVLIGPIGLHVKGHPVADHWFATEAERDSILYRELSNKPEVEPDEYIANEAGFARLAWSPRMVGVRLRPRLGRLGVPTTVIWGEHDAVVPSAHVAAWEECLPRATTVMIADAGHYPVYEQPIALSARIRDVLAHQNATNASTEGSHR